jgi:ABC-type branched-subunit amino acid transport system permease subunit
MVYLYSIISGFRAILGSVGIQIAMAVAVAFFVKVPKTPYLVETEEYTNAELSA